MSHGITIAITRGDQPDTASTAGTSGTRAEVAAFARDIAAMHGAVLELPAAIAGLHEAVAANGVTIRAFVTTRADQPGVDHDHAEVEFRRAAFGWSRAAERVPEDRLPADIREKLPNGGP